MGAAKPNSPYRDETFDAMVDRRRKARMDAIDALPPDVRALVHDYGYQVVRAFLDQGVKKAGNIRHLVETVLDEFSPTRGTRSNQGVKTNLSHPPLTVAEASEAIDRK